MLGLSHGVNTDTAGIGRVFSNNYSLLLDGSDQAVQIDGLANDFDKAKGTMSVWVRPNSPSGSQTWLMVAVDANNFYRIWWHHSSTLIKGQIKAGGSADLVQYEDTGFASSSSWYHIVMTWNAGADEMKLYVNNDLKETDGIDNYGDFSASAFAVADIGKNGQANNAYWKGYIDEVSIFDETLSADQVSTLYSGGSPKDVEFSSLSGLIGYYRFTEGSGTSAVDESGTGNTGTLENAPTWSTIVP
jgi:hypothetical protein